MPYVPFYGPGPANVLFTGDSITAGAAPPEVVPIGGPRVAVATAHRNLTFIGTYDYPAGYHHFATGGQNTRVLNTQFPAEYAANPAGIVITMIGTNDPDDSAGGFPTPAQSAARYLNMVNVAAAINPNVQFIWMDVINRSTAYPTQNAYYVSLRSEARLALAGKANSRCVAQATVPDANFSDGIHLNLTGNAVYAANINAAIVVLGY